MKKFAVLVCLCLITIIQPAPAATPYKSSVLGATKASWESRHGSGQPSEVEGFIKYKGDVEVIFMDGKAWHIERAWGDDDAVSIADARKEYKKYIPADARFGKTYTSRSGNTVDLYNSKSLRSRFPSSYFTNSNGKPGDFIVIFHNQTGYTTRFVIGIGNNP